MSKGPGNVQTWIVEALRKYSHASTAALHTLLMAERNAPGKLARSVRHSLTRALRGLEAAGTIKRDGIDQRWTTAGAVVLDLDAERTAKAFHEAGHAVIARSRQLPVGFATINPRGSMGGYVTGIHDRPNAVGLVTAPVRKQIKFKDGRQTRIHTYRTTEDVADLHSVDAFGNPLPKRRPRSTAEHTAEILMCIAGGMAEAVHLDRDPMTWRKFASNADVNIARDHMLMSAPKAKSWDEYAADTLALIRKHWQMIEAVAADLLKHDTLSGFDIDEICCRVARSSVRRQHLAKAKAKR